MRTTLVLIALVWCSSLLAQDGWDRADKRAYEEADFAYYQEDFVYAADIFADLYLRHKDYAPLDLRYGVSLLEIGQKVDTAKVLIGSAFRAGEKEALFHQGRVFHLDYKFDQAIEAFTRYSQVASREVEQAIIDRYISECRTAKRMVADPVDVHVQNIGPAINTEYKEYVPIINRAGNTVYFTSRRKGSTAQLKDPNGEYFEDIYVSEKIEGKWTEAKNIGLPVNSETHDATVAVSGDGKTMIIYRTNSNLTGGDLYMCKKRGDKWTEPRKLGKNVNSQYQEASACLTQDGKMMIFSSNRPGGYGGKDLYRVRQLPNGEWSLPKNLGPVINSERDEDAPFLDIDDETLYFSSNGHQTMGGYDVFISRLIESDTWSIPENIGYPLNTVEDDIYLTVSAGGRTGYFSSAREDGFGQLDVYEVDFIYRQDKIMVIQGEVLDIYGEPCQAKVTLFDESEREIVGIYNTNPQTGKFILVVNPLTVYKVFVEASGFRTQQDELFFMLPEEDDLEYKIAPYLLLE